MTTPPSSPSAEYVVPDAIGELLVARAWKVKGWDLRSVHCLSAWEPGAVLEARCDPAGRALRRLMDKLVDPGDHDSPAESCGCGIYGVFDPEELKLQLGFGIHAVVWGIAAVWGKVVVGERGVRGQYARPVALFHQPPPASESWTNWNPPRVEAPAIQRLADRYGLDLIDRWADLVRPEDL